ncbi:MAG: hypothetical protein ACK4NR_00115 [Micavibrio sp.]
MARFPLFIFAILIYGLLGTPTPDHFGIVEIIVGGLLLFVCGPAGVMQAASFYKGQGLSPVWLESARWLMLWGLTVPVLTGFLQGHEPIAIGRDLMAFLFFLLPLWIPFALMPERRHREILLWVLCALGLVFVLRVMVSFWVAHQGQSLPFGFVPDPHNLVNAPTVLLAALWFTGQGGRLLIEARKGRDVAGATFLFLLAFVILAGMAAIGQRAHIGAWLVALLFWLGLLGLKAPFRLGRPLLLSGLVLLCLWPWAADIATGLLQKNTLVGLNNRWEEAAAVWQSFGGNPWTILFGQGWGASFVSPAVGPFAVTYTHALPTYFIMKTGVVGLMLALAYLVAIAVGLWRISWSFPVLAVALAAPFLIDISLYASFKTLDFGLLLLLISLWTTRTYPALKSCQNGSGWCMQEDNP